MALTVTTLRSRPELCAFFTRRFEEEWPEWYGPGGKGNAAEDVAAFANAEGNIPVAVVAVDDDGSPVGIAALRATSIATHTHLSPWASAGYVVPSRRRAGVGAKLLSALLSEAERLGVPTLYCATATAVTLLEREGWYRLESIVYEGEIQHIFQRLCLVSPN